MRARPRPPVQGRGIFSGTGLIIVCLAATLAALVFPIWSYADRSDPTGSVNVLSAQTVSTAYGPLSAQDRDFIVKVRLAGLWELPAGEMAEQKGTTAAVRTAGQHLVDGHTSLDAHVRTVATQLGVPIPNAPNVQQQQWLATLNAAQGQDFDREFANIVRLAHGRVFSVVAQVRAATQNTLVRDLADDANSTVLDHIKVLEATGYVDFGTLARQLAGTPSPVAAPPVVAPADATPIAPGPTSAPSPTYTLPPATASPETAAQNP
jgi:predicted outer membrane protein